MLDDGSLAESFRQSRLRWVQKDVHDDSIKLAVIFGNLPRKRFSMR